MPLPRAAIIGCLIPIVILCSTVIRLQIGFNGFQHVRGTLGRCFQKKDAESLDVANVTASQSCVGMHAEEPMLHFEVVLAEMTPFQSRG
jgi:hypothetical protein